MNLNQLAEKALAHAVNRDNGASEKVDYVHYGTGSKEEGINCFPQKINDGELAKDTEKSYVTFHGLILTEYPDRGDSIHWNGKKYHFQKTTSQIGNSSYDVLAYVSTHSPRGRR